MRKLFSTTVLVILMLMLFLASCNDAQFSNPSSPSATPSVIRTATVTELGGVFNFPDIGMQITFPDGAIPVGEVYTFNVQSFPPDIPLVPSDTTYIRLGTFALEGEDIVFDEIVEVRFPLADLFAANTYSGAFNLTDANAWVPIGNAPVLDDGRTAMMSIDAPGTYGSFQNVPLHVEITVSQQSGTVPLSVAFKAIVTGGTPPYNALWWYGDDDDPDGGLTVSHIYVEPGDYSASVQVFDADGESCLDWIHLTCYGQSGPPWIP